MKRLSFTIIGAFLIASFAQITAAQSKTAAPALTNGDIVSMVRAKLSPDIIRAKIQTSACAFDTSPVALEKLKAAGVPDNVILVMVKNSPPNSSKSKTSQTPLQTEPKHAYPEEPPRSQASAVRKTENAIPVLLIVGNAAQNRHGKIGKQWVKEFSKAKGCFGTVTDSGTPHNYELIVTEQKKSGFVTVMANQQPSFEATLTGPKGKYIASKAINPKLFGHNHSPWSRARAFAESQICGNP